MQDLLERNMKRHVSFEGHYAAKGNRRVEVACNVQVVRTEEQLTVVALCTLACVTKISPWPTKEGLVAPGRPIVGGGGDSMALTQ
jgi:hypothetical protein